MSERARHSAPDEFQLAIDAYLRGDESRADVLCQRLGPAVRRSAGRFVGSESADLDDVVQDSLLAVLAYLRRHGDFTGDLEKVAVTIANNRCRDLLRTRQRRPQVPIDDFGDWLADPTRSPLDHLLEDEVFDTLQTTLDHLSRDCRWLLRAFYILELSMEEIRRRIGLTTVQGVYHRRAVCLQRAARLLNRSLSERP